MELVTMRLDWLFQGPNSGFIVAKDKGYYEQLGLDVTIGTGSGSGSTAQLIGSKGDMIGFADGYVVGNSVSKGLDIRMVASIYRRNPTAVLVLADSPIETPKDLEGKTIGIPTGGAQFQQWPAYAKGCGLDTSRIQLVNVDPASTSAALMQRRIDALAAYAQSAAPPIEVRGGMQTNLFWFTDCGVTSVSNGNNVHNDLNKERPDLIRDFVAASIRGFLYTRRNPDEAVAIVEKFGTGIDPAIARRELELSWQTWVTPNTEGRPLGWMAEQDWQATVEILREYGGVTTPLDAKQLYTNDFIPTGEEFEPPRTQ
jgi:NitT/TauT family transport system substrate-binding protein